MGPAEVALIAEVIGHPVRYRVTTALEEESDLTVRQIAERIGEPARRVTYQLRLLRESGLVEISGRRQRRGAIEYRFSMVRRLVLADREYDALHASVRARAASEVFRLIAADVDAAARQGTFGTRRGHAEIRCFGEVDRRGWEALASIHRRHLREAEQILEEAGKRIAKRGESGIAVTVGVLLFEGPDRPVGTTRHASRSGLGFASPPAGLAGDPTSFRLATLISERPGLTVRQIVDLTGEPARRVRYHLDQLRKADRIEVSDQQARRGAIEHHYSVTYPVILTDEDLDSIDDPLQARIAMSVFLAVAADVLAATRERTFGLRPGHAQVRSVGEVDGTGWEDLSRMSHRYLAEVQRVLDEAGERGSTGAEDWISATAALFLFEVPARASTSSPA